MKINKKKFLLFFVFFLLLYSSCLLREVTYYSALTMLPETTRDMKSSGFWISIHPYPDKILLTKEEINNLNLNIIDKNNSVKNILLFDDIITGKQIKKQIEQLFNYISKSKHYHSNGKLVVKNFYKEIKENIGFNNIPENINVQYGFIIKFTDQRIIPSSELLSSIQRELFFDDLQMSALDLATPVAVLHKTKDDKWYFVHSKSTDGWVKKENIVLCSKDQLKKYLTQDVFAVVTNPKCEIFFNENLTGYYDYARMGVILPIIEKKDNEIFKIIIPYFDNDFNYIEKKAYIKKSDINQGFLDYTPRNIITQSFKLINTPYGWGGMFGEQDCSKFLYEIFSCVGIYLPRNSSIQSKVGNIIMDIKNNKELSDEQKLQIIKEKCIPGITFFRLNGHIMLYLGNLDGKPFVIHSIWAYREKLPAQDRIRMINKVTVSDLSLGKNTKKGSLLERINRINNVLLID